MTARVKGPALNKPAIRKTKANGLRHAVDPEK